MAVASIGNVNRPRVVEKELVASRGLRDDRFGFALVPGYPAFRNMKSVFRRKPKGDRRYRRRLLGFGEGEFSDELSFFGVDEDDLVGVGKGGGGDAVTDSQAPISSLVSSLVYWFFIDGFLPSMGYGGESEFAMETEPTKRGSGGRLWVVVRGEVCAPVQLPPTRSCPDLMAVEIDPGKSIGAFGDGASR